MDYYLWQNSKNPGEAMLYGAWPSALAESMLTGNPIGRALPTIELRMNERSQGLLTDNVLMTGQGRILSSRFVQLLRRCGVDNLEIFPCRIQNEVTGETHENFLLVNVIGRIACVDRGASACEYIDDELTQILIWDYLTLDENRIHGELLFVLAEMPVQIVVHNTIKEAIEEAGLTGVEFIAQGDHAFKPEAPDIDF